MLEERHKERPTADHHLRTNQKPTRSAMAQSQGPHTDPSTWSPSRSSETDLSWGKGLDSTDVSESAELSAKLILADDETAHEQRGWSLDN